MIDTTSRHMYPYVSEQGTTKQQDPRLRGRAWHGGCLDSLSDGGRSCLKIGEACWLILVVTTVSQYGTTGFGHIQHSLHTCAVFGTEQQNR